MLITVSSTYINESITMFLLYKLTVDSSQYDMASVLGILIFIVVAFFSLFVYSRIGSVKNEEDFQ